MLIFFQVSSFVQLQATKWWRSGVRWRWHSLCYGKMWRRLVRRNFSKNRNFRNISRKLCSQSINVLKIIIVAFYDKFSLSVAKLCIWPNFRKNKTRTTKINFPEFRKIFRDFRKNLVIIIDGKFYLAILYFLIHFQKPILKQLSMTAHLLTNTNV